MTALETVRPEQVAELGASRLLSELATVASLARYWQEPDGDYERLQLPEVVAALRPIAEALTRNRAAAW